MQQIVYLINCKDMNKRLLSLCLALTAMTLGAMAADELSVGGKKVTLSGSGTVTVSGGDIKSGSVEYDRDSKTLTLKNVTIERSGNNNRGLLSKVSGLTVKFVGTNTITTTSAAGLRFEASATITGSGTVTVTSNETAFYVYKNTTVTIKGQDRNRITLNLDGKYGIQGEDGNSSEKVSIQRYVTLTASGTSNALKYLSDLTVSGDPNVTLKGNGSNRTIQSLASLTLTEGVVIDLPLKGKFNSSEKTVMEGSSIWGCVDDITIKLAKVAINATNFPGDNFRSYIASSSIDLNLDGYLSDAEIQNRKALYPEGDIKDLTGIEYFTYLTYLSCNNCKLTSLDVSKNTALTTLDCSFNKLTSLDVSKNTALTKLSCSGNSLEYLDVSNNTALKELYCWNNSLTSLDVSNNTALTTLCCYENQIKGLAMDNLVNGLGEKYGTLCVCKKGASIDNIITTAQVSVATYKGWTVKRVDDNDTWVEYAGVYESFDINAANFPDLNFRNYLLTQDYGKGAVLTDSEIITITELDVSKKNISNLIGIKYFWALNSLFCNDNRLKSLDVSKNTILRELYCFGNQISGTGMSQLVNSLPTRTTSSILLVCADYVSTDNIITSAQVKKATGKGWTVKKYNSDGNAVDYAGLGDVNGDNKIDLTDLNTIVKIIMGQVNLGYAGDLNMDGKTDAADIVLMVRILKSLGK